MFAADIIYRIRNRRVYAAEFIGARPSTTLAVVHTARDRDEGVCVTFLDTRSHQRETSDIECPAWFVGCPAWRIDHAAVCETGVIAMVPDGGPVRTWNAVTSACGHVLGAHTDPCLVRFTVQGHRPILAVGHRSGTVTVWDADAGVLLHTFPGNGFGRVSDISFASANTVVVIGGYRGITRARGITDGRDDIGIGNALRGQLKFAFSADGTYVAHHGMHTPSVTIERIGTPMVPVSAVELTRYTHVERLLFSADSLYLFIMTTATVEIWTVHACNCVHVVRGTTLLTHITTRADELIVAKGNGNVERVKMHDALANRYLVFVVAHRRLRKQNQKVLPQELVSYIYHEYICSV